METNFFKQNKQKQLKVLYMTTLILFLPLFGSLYYLYSLEPEPEVVEIVEEQIVKIDVDLKNIKTTADSVMVISLNDGKVLYQKNPNTLLPLASLTKLMTAKVADDQTSKNYVTVNKMQDPTYGDSKLSNGEVWNKENLIAYTLITSSNDGAHTLSLNTDSSSFVNSMNSLASTIGLTSTKFYNETGLDNDEASIPGSKGTVSDVSKLLSYLIKNDIGLYEKTKYETSLIDSPTGYTLAKNTNEAADEMIGLLVSKTGYTDIAGGNLAIVADMGLNEPTAFVVLHSSKEDRFNDVLKLQNEYFAQVANRMR